MFTRQSIHIALEAWGVIFCIIAAVCLSYSSQKSGVKNKYLVFLQLSIACYLLTDAIAWRYRGMEGPVGYYLVRISNFLTFLSALVMPIAFHIYLCHLLFASDWSRHKRKFYVRAVFYLCLVGIILLIISQFTNLYYYFDENNFYHRNTWHTLHMILVLVAMVMDFVLVVRYRKRLSKNMRIAIMSYFVLPFVATVIQIFYYGLSLAGFAVGISATFIFMTEVMEQSRELTQKQEELYEMRANMMLSQIQPHMIYNTLTTIKHLCKKNPELAAQTVDDFASYLRGNLESVNSGKPIPFEKELAHVETYLSIEKIRFGDRIRTEYHIEDSEFYLPALTIQPMVENAVKHGIRKRTEGGTIRIDTLQDETYHIVRIVDDGVGFDTMETQDLCKHTGIENVRTRLSYMCGGTLNIQSKKDVGTTVEILVPKK